jgi:hypothetical protein
MESIVLNRLHDFEGVTRGELIADTAHFYTLELFWKNNATCESCIPGGTYHIKKVSAEKWEVLNVPGREGIQIHAGNTAADTTGCILIGKSRGILEGMPAVLQSKEAMEAFNEVMGDIKEALLEIRNLHC